MEEAREVVPKCHPDGYKQLKCVVRKFLDNDIDRHELQKATEQIEGSQPKYPTVAITALTLKDVGKCFRLQYDKLDTELSLVQPLPLPPHLVRTLGLIKKATSNSTVNEASTRWIVDAVILQAYEEATVDIKNAQPLNVHCERSYQFGPVRPNKKKVILSGRPDYDIWYGDSESLCLIVLIVEAINPIVQLLGYMGCIHRARKSEGKRNCAVYGMATDGVFWYFLKIAHNSKWTHYIVGGDGKGLETPFGLLVWMLKRAAILSPPHSKETSAETDDEPLVCPMDVTPDA